MCVREAGRVCLTLFSLFPQKMRPYQKEHLIEKLPSLLEWYGYVYFFPSLLAGPAVEMRDYNNYISGAMFKVRLKTKTIYTSFFTYTLIHLYTYTLIHLYTYTLIHLGLCIISFLSSVNRTALVANNHPPFCLHCVHWDS